MPPRSKSLVVLAFVLLAVYLLFYHDDTPMGYGTSQPPSADVLNSYLADLEVAETAEHKSSGYIDLSSGVAGLEATENTDHDRIAAEHKSSGYIDLSPGFVEPASTPAWYPPPEPTREIELLETTTSSAEFTIATADPELPKSRVNLQEEFEKELAELAQKETAGMIYGTTLSTLVDVGAHEDFAASALAVTDTPLPYCEAPPYKYDVYPDYNSKVWKATNKGTYKKCDGPLSLYEDMLVFSGRPPAFGEPPMGSYMALELDSNLCFERETRLGRYGFQNKVDSTDSVKLSKRLAKRTDWDSIDWGALQQECAVRNSDRYARVQGTPSNNTFSYTGISNSTTRYNGTGRSRRRNLETRLVEDFRHKTLDSSSIKPKARTAVIIRTHSDQNFTENDKQNIRALITELSLRSGGEYQVYLLVQVKDDSLPIYADANAYNEVLQKSTPQEFWHITVLWNEAKMKQIYPDILPRINNVHQSQWLSVQKFAQDYPDFDYYWNWEFDTRYTGHYYNLLEKLASFAKKQPRKYLWERNERYYIPSFHGRWSQFLAKVVPESDKDTLWGPPPNPVIRPVGPTRPHPDPSGDDYQWGVGEEADYISLAPMFNPILTKWTGRGDIWGYLHEDTPRRATVGTTSRCSKLLLDTMHAENLKGNHASSEMTPQTVALLHGLKAVYAPIPMFFDKPWGSSSLAKYFNPGPKGESGSSAESPYGWGKETRFEGSTWYYRATPPLRLYNNWLGWEDSGIGGPEWEKNHGRICLPPMLLHPIKDVVKPPPGFSSKSDLPYQSKTLR